MGVHAGSDQDCGDETVEKMMPFMNESGFKPDGLGFLKHRSKRLNSEST